MNPAPNRIDCHAHVIDPKAFPFQPGVGYTPRADETGTAGAFRATLAASSVSHAVLVQPSCYGTDNAAMMNTITASDGRMKGIVVLSPDAPETRFARLAEAGAVGLRLNLQQTDPYWLRMVTVSR